MPDVERHIPPIKVWVPMLVLTVDEEQGLPRQIQFIVTVNHLC